MQSPLLIIAIKSDEKLINASFKASDFLKFSFDFV